MIMPAFMVTVTRDTTESITFEMNGSTMALAEAAALADATENPHDFNWVADDCTGGEPYLSAPGDSDCIGEAA